MNRDWVLNASPVILVAIGEGGEGDKEEFKPDN